VRIRFENIRYFW